MIKREIQAIQLVIKNKSRLALNLVLIECGGGIELLDAQHLYQLNVIRRMEMSKVSFSVP